MAGMIWVDGLHYSPIAFLLMTAAFRSMDPSLEESALMSGASILQIACRITFKLAWPAVLAALLILFVRASSPSRCRRCSGCRSASTSSPRRSTRRSTSTRARSGSPSSYAITLLLLVLRRHLPAVAAVLVRARASRPSPARASARAPSTSAAGAGSRRRMFMIYFLVIVLLPFLVLVWTSLQKYYSAPSWEALSRLSFDDYRAVLDYPGFWHARCGTACCLSLDCATHRHARRRGDLLGGGAHQDSRALAARQPGVAAAGVPRPRARPRDHDLLPAHRHRRLRHDLDPADRLRDALPALRHALRHRPR